jgi:acetyltransferase-like isoleucine patch superfamily enzyme
MIKKYHQQIQELKENNKRRKHPRRYFVMRLEGEDAKRNAIFSSFRLDEKSHMIFRGYISKIASLLPPSALQQFLFRLAGLVIDEDVFIAPELTIDIVLEGWTRFRRGVSVGLKVNCFNHLFEQNGKIILGYIDVGEGASIGGFTTISPGVIIGEKADIGAEVKIGPGVQIGEKAKIGPCVIISSFLTIGEGAIVRPGSVVLENVPPDTMVEGNPAKIIKHNVRCKPLSDQILQAEK